MSQTLKISGHFKAAGKPRKWGDDHYATKFWVDIDKDGDYPTMGEFEVYKDKVDLSKLKSGDKVEVSFNIRGAKREWESDGEKKSAFFQTLDAWKVEAKSSTPPPADAKSADEPEDDLPF